MRLLLSATIEIGWKLSSTLDARYAEARSRGKGLSRRPGHLGHASRPRVTNGRSPRRNIVGVAFGGSGSGGASWRPRRRNACLVSSTWTWTWTCRRSASTGASTARRCRRADSCVSGLESSPPPRPRDQSETSYIHTSVSSHQSVYHARCRPTRRGPCPVIERLAKLSLIHI